MSSASLANNARKEYPLVDRYFGKFLSKLLRGRQGCPSYRGKFVLHAFYSEALEARLSRVESLAQTQGIVREVGDCEDIHELDRRLMDAWSEIRVLDQLQREGFQRICKIKETADFTAEKNGIRYALQVTHVNRTLESQVVKCNPPELQDTSPYGDIQKIQERLATAVSCVFWEGLRDKNADLGKWPAGDWRRCIVLVTNQERLQDPMVRHIACQGLRACIRDLTSVNFEELVWLLDNGNGAWFYVDATDGKIGCLADWKDEFPEPDTDLRAMDVSKVTRREVDLDSPLPVWVGASEGRA